MVKSLLSSTYNTREVTKYLWRSDALLKLGDADIQLLKASHIRNIIDLRGHKVAAQLPCSLLNDPYFYYQNIQVENAGESNTFVDWISYYKSILHGYNFDRVLMEIANAPEGVLVNCTAGKDRTGVVIMTIEYILGIPHEDIIQHYLDSAKYLTDWCVWWEKHHGLSVEDNQPRREYAECVLSDKKIDELKHSAIGDALRNKFRKG